MPAPATQAALPDFHLPERAIRRRVPAFNHAGDAPVLCDIDALLVPAPQASAETPFDRIIVVVDRELRCYRVGVTEPTWSSAETPQGAGGVAWFKDVLVVWGEDGIRQLDPVSGDRRWIRRVDELIPHDAMLAAAVLPAVSD